MKEEYYLDACFLVDYFHPTDIQSRNQARACYETIMQRQQNCIIVSWEAILEAIGKIGELILRQEIRCCINNKPVGVSARQCLEQQVADTVERIRNQDYFPISTLSRMRTIMSEISRWEVATGRRLIFTAPANLDEDLYEEAKEVCIKYSCSPLYVRNTPPQPSCNGIGGMDALHLVYAKSRVPRGSRVIILTDDQALQQAVSLESRIVQSRSWW